MRYLYLSFEAILSKRCFILGSAAEIVAAFMTCIALNAELVWNTHIQNIGQVCHFREELQS